MDRLLIAGGKLDANLRWLAAAADRLGVATETVLVAPDGVPEFIWSLEERVATVDGVRLEASAAFIRYDVFSTIASRSPGAAASAQAWFAALVAWSAIAEHFSFNRHIDFATGSKLTMLDLASKFGLRTPPTIVTNARAVAIPLGDPATFIAKPVAGGSYVMALGDALAATSFDGDRSPSPAIVQPRLSYPERRIYRVGPEFFAFDIRAETIDSRLDSKGSIAPLPLEELPPGVVEALRALTDHVSCDFCAIDMKTDPATGDLAFLELNNGPMFMGYDQTCGGVMAEAMVRYLMADARV